MCASHTNVELAMDDASAPDDDLDSFQFTGARFFIASAQNATGADNVSSSRVVYDTDNKKNNLRFEQQTVK